MAHHIVVAGLFSGLIFTPTQASASVFSALTARTAQADTAGILDATLPQNSQNMTLAVAAIGPGALSKTSLADIVIADSALAPAMGPIGNASEAEEASDAGDYITAYTVRSGDTIKSVAGMFDVTPATIMWANDLTANAKLKAGMTLVIPPISGRIVTLKKGDTFQSLAKKYGVEASAIAFANDKSLTDDISVGEMLIIPDDELAAPSTKPTTTTTAPRSTQKPSAGNYFIYPLPVSSSRFVRGPHGNYGGVDISAPIGTPIYAVANGTVTVAKSEGYNTGWGSYVVINHKLPNGQGAQTLSAHMSRVVAQVGQTVKAGDVIGYVGTTGKVTGPHLHIEVRGVSNPFANPSYGRK